MIAVLPVGWYCSMLASLATMDDGRRTVHGPSSIVGASLLATRYSLLSTRSAAAQTSSAVTALWYCSSLPAALRMSPASEAPALGATATLRPEGSHGPKRAGSLGPKTATTGVRTAVATCMAPVSLPRKSLHRS